MTGKLFDLIWGIFNKLYSDPFVFLIEDDQELYLEGKKSNLIME